jgi:hypothetical protein
LGIHAIGGAGDQRTSFGQQHVFGDEEFPPPRKPADAMSCVFTIRLHSDFARILRVYKTANEHHWILAIDNE